MWHWLICWPKSWEPFRRAKVFDDDDMKTSIGEAVYLRCKKCGWVVRRNLY